MERDFVFLRTPKGAAFAAGCVKGLCRKVMDKRFLRLTGLWGRCAARVQRVQKVQKVQRVVVSPLRGDEYKVSVTC